MDWRKCIVIDFESVIAPVANIPIENTREAINLLRKKGYLVEITSTRCSEIAGINAIEEYLVENEIEFDYVRFGIPPCICYVSNSALSFHGDVSKMLDQIVLMSR